MDDDDWVVIYSDKHKAISAAVRHVPVHVTPGYHASLITQDGIIEWAVGKTKQDALTVLVQKMDILRNEISEVRTAVVERISELNAAEVSA